jgi:hypothetical protein
VSSKLPEGLDRAKPAEVAAALQLVGGDASRLRARVNGDGSVSVVVVNDAAAPIPTPAQTTRRPAGGGPACVYVVLDQIQPLAWLVDPAQAVRLADIRHGYVVKLPIFYDARRPGA